AKRPTQRGAAVAPGIRDRARTRFAHSPAQPPGRGPPDATLRTGHPPASGQPAVGRPAVAVQGPVHGQGRCAEPLPGRPGDGPERRPADAQRTTPATATLPAADRYVLA